MAFYLKIALALITVINIIDCGVMDDIRYNNVNYFIEITSKQFRHHAARFRSFVRQDGTPISSIRIGRSIREVKKKLNIKCVLFRN